MTEQKVTVITSFHILTGKPSTSNTTSSENDLKTVEQTYNWQKKRKDYIEKGEGAESQLIRIQALALCQPTAGGRKKCDGEGKNTQEPGNPGLGDLLWEDESPQYWALKTNGTRHQGEAEHCGKQSLRLWRTGMLVDPSEIQHRGSSLKGYLLTLGSVPEGHGSESILSRERMAMPLFQQNWPDTWRIQL